MTLLGNIDQLDEVAQWALNQTDQDIRRLNGNPFTDGKRLEELDLTTTETTVAHGLGRKPKGMLVISKNAALHVFESTKSDENHLYLKSDGTVTATVWVF